ncbi:MAG: leucine-rich repeat protein [Bacteroidaceae bacterium]|nr:leucine-rich repeat protein [Bacteroidaceae bacterium]
MKKTFLVLAAVLLSLCEAGAQVVSESEARQVAERFVTSTTPAGVRRMPAATAKSLQLAHTARVGSEAPELYVYNVAQGGFVIVSGDAATDSEVLGWSDTGVFDADNLPDGLQFLLGSYARGIAAFRAEATPEVKSRVARAPRRASGYGSVAPMLKTIWNQLGYDVPGHYTGCVATAVAQLMNFYRWPQHGYGNHTNVHKTSQSVDFTQSTYNWSKMPTGYGEADEAAAVGKLMYDIGCAVNMQYGSDGSSAYDFNAYKALVSNFGYDEESLEIYDRLGNYASLSTSEWDAKIRSELRAGRPVYYSGCDTIWKEDYIYGQKYRYIDMTEAHAFVCDGFSDDGLFHFNFGWGGQCDGYYNTKVIRPFGENDKSHSYAPVNVLITGFRPASREKVEAGGAYFDLADDGSHAIVASSPTVYAGDVTIPSEITVEGKTYPVEGVRSYALKERIDETQAITNLTFGAKIDEFPRSLFANNANIESVTFTGGVGRLENQAFIDCDNLKSVSLTGVQHIGEEAFARCDNLQSVTLGEGVKSVGRASFRYCPALETLTMAEGLDSIASQAFVEDKKLNFESLPASVRHLGDEAFMATAVERVTIPTSVTLGRGVFADCTSLSDATLEDGLTEVADSLFYNTKLYSLDVPASVTRIGRHAVNSTSLWRLKFHAPSFVIENGGIRGASGMEVEGLDGCRSIGEQGLSGPTGTFTVNPKTTYASRAVQGDFDKIVIPAAVTDFDPISILSTKEYVVDAANPNYAGNGAYLFTKDMKCLLIVGTTEGNERIIPSGTESISEHVGLGRYYIYLPASLQTIDQEDIYGYDVRTVYAMSPVPPVFTKHPGAAHPDFAPYITLHVPQGTADAYRAAPVWKEFPIIEDDLIVEDAFIYRNGSVIGRNTAVKTGPDVVIPATLLLDGKRIPVTNVEACVFQGDLTVETVKVPAFVYGSPIFKDCANLRRVTLGEELRDIYGSAFENCRSLESVEVNGPLRYIGPRAFWGCSSLKSMDCAGADQLYESTFEGCTSLTTVTGLENAYALPNRFFANSGIQTFRFGPHNSMQDDTFADCPRLHTLTVDPANERFFAVDGILYRREQWSDNVEMALCPPMERKADGTIGERTVVNVSEECNYMPSRSLPEGTKEVIFPESMRQVNWGCGTRAEGLEKVTALFDNPDYGSLYMFYYTCYAGATLQVPKGKKEAFAAHDDWKRFGTIVEIDPADYPSPEQIQRDAQNVVDDETIGTELVLLMKDGTTHSVNLVAEPVLTIDGANLNIVGIWVKLSLPLADVVRYTFEPYDITGIEELRDDNPDADLAFDGDAISVRGLAEGSRLAVYDVKGLLHRSTTATANGTAALSLSGLPTGMYIVKAGEVSYKVYKK